MKPYAFLREYGRYLIAAGVMLFLTACGGGDNGEAGAPGQPGPGTVSTATALKVEVTNVAVQSPPLVEFYIKDQNGIPFTGLKATDVSLTIAQLKPGVNGEPSAWQNYLNVLKTPTAGVWPGTEAKVQGTTEKATAGKLVNNGDGSYSYTFATDITKVTSPLAVPHDATLTHRLGIQFSSGVPVTNTVYTWQPSTGATTSITNRDIVKTESCNECHGKLAMHGGGRTETKYCVTCHNPGSTDPESGNTIDFKVMVHKLHMGKNLPSVIAGGSYTIWGHLNTKFDFSDVVFPQDVRNCTKCHDGNDADTPQANNWQYRPSAEACGSCHDDVNFATGLNHPEGAQSNAACSDCHTAGGAAGPVAASHIIPAQVTKAKFAYSITGATYDASTKKVTAQFKVTDPTNNNAPYTLTETVWTSGTPKPTLRLNIAWDTRDYSNTGANPGPVPVPAVAKALQIAFLNAGVLDTTRHSYNATTGVHTVISDVLPAEAQATGSGSVAIEGYPKVDYVVDATTGQTVTVSTPVTSAVAYFKVNDTTVNKRRVVVDNAKCLQCHETLSVHGTNRVNETAICVTCHNPNNTDIAVRPTAGTAADGKKEESIDFKRMIHGIHAADKDGHGFRDNGLVVYGHIQKTSTQYNAFNFGHVRFPGILSNCATCHTGTSYQLPLSPAVQPSTIDTNTSLKQTQTGWALETWISDTDPLNDLVITPAASVCSSCHDRSIAKAHMEQNGGAFGVTRLEASGTVEVCEICHGPGRIGDVAVMHGVK